MKKKTVAEGRMLVAPTVVAAKREAREKLRQETIAEFRERLRTRYGHRYLKDCPSCSDGILFFKNGPYPGSMFIACSNYPRCEHREAMPKPVPVPDAATVQKTKEELAAAPKCPKCGAALRRIEGKYGPFIGCSGFSRGCKYTEHIPIAPPPVISDGEELVGRFE
jgi:ssDNA-binding Zn-finger/Zn-ribbon topoisomerase 1